MKIVATAFSLLLMWSVDAAHAAPIAFEVEYTTLFNQFCFFHSGICVPRPLDSFTRTFTLDSSDLMVDGVYDVAASVDPVPPFTLPNFPVTPDATFTMSLVANAIVADEHVIDLVMDFEGTIDEDCFGFHKLTRSSFTASSGSWESAIAASAINDITCNPFSTAANGTYTVQQLPVEVPVAVPEPGSLLLVLGGGLFARLRTRPRRVH